MSDKFPFSTVAGSLFYNAPQSGDQEATGGNGLSIEAIFSGTVATLAGHGASLFAGTERMSVFSEETELSRIAGQRLRTCHTLALCEHGVLLGTQGLQVLHRARRVFLET